jgi:hypothetical protein
MKEVTDTRGEGLKPGKYTFTVASTPIKDKFKNSGKPYYDFTFETTVDGNLKEHNEKIPTWLAAPILRALGAKETSEGVFEWDRDQVVGTMFDAEIVLEKMPDGKEYRRLTSPVAILKKSDEKVPF